MCQLKVCADRINSAAQSGSGGFNAWKHSALSQTTLDGKYCMTAQVEEPHQHHIYDIMVTLYNALVQVHSIPIVVRLAMM